MVMMISDLPKDLESKILARVPAKSLWELRGTCKRWYALFKDSKFVKKNKKMSKPGRESMLLSNHEVYSIAGDLHNIKPSRLEFTGKLTSLKGSEDLYFSAIHHCDGLMLCQTKDKSRLVVWNPCTGQKKMIEPRTRYRNDIFALGYSSTCSRRSYKILRCCDYVTEEKVLVVESEIYELSSDSWRVIDAFTVEYTLFRRCISLKGDSYWVAGNGTGFFLMKFDFTTDAFVRLPFPFHSYDFQDTVLLSVVNDEKLAVSLTLVGSDVMRIWIDDKEARDLSWRSGFDLQVYSARYNVDIDNFLLDEENRVAVCCGKYEDRGGEWTMIHIFGEDMNKIVYEVYEVITNASHLDRPHVMTYVPSLFRIH